MLFPEDPAQLEYPTPMVLETGLTANEIQELLSLFQPSQATSPVTSGSDGSNRTVYPIDERKRRRMISNRESARRSRWRRKRHLQNLTEQVKKLALENQVLKNRLGWVLNGSYVLCRENNRLRSESLALRVRLSDLHNVLVAMQTMHDDKNNTINYRQN